jgi:Fic-DOC domain mobile mystery protein B
VKRILFRDRDGRTPLPEDFKKDIIPHNVRTSRELDEYEEENIVEGLVWLDDCDDDCRDWMFWLKLHKKLFEKVWKWAGKIRDHELENDHFDHPGYIQEHIKKLEGDLQYWLKERPFQDDREILVRFHERMLTIHPFSNGNGRTTRILTEYIAKKEDLPVPSWGASLRDRPKKHRDAYISAVVKARKEHHYEDLLKFMYG